MHPPWSTATSTITEPGCMLRTISRVTSNKYMATPRGLFELRDRLAEGRRNG